MICPGRRAGWQRFTFAGLVGLAGATLMGACSVGLDQTIGPVTTTADGSATTTELAEPSAAEGPVSGGATPVEVVVRSEPDPAGWSTIASQMPALALPSDCPLPLNEFASLPNSAREYRGGVHQGIDFICGERGRDAVAALAGRVVQVNSTYVDPTPDDRAALLQEAQALGRTPPWTLAFLYGRYVVLDHGVIDGVGHVVTVHAHLEQVAPAVLPGVRIDAGQVLGEIGNRGTDSAATGELDPRSLHLHWELLVDDVYFSAGLSSAETARLYSVLFDGSGAP
jgi:murein DD-endopeptidase MepM/ murein hydrolase activator NlpD